MNKMLIQNIIDRINLLDDNGLGQDMLSIIGMSRSLFHGEKTGSVLWADIEEHPIATAPKAYGIDKAFQVFGHTRIDVINSGMVLSDHLAMIDSQKCFMIDKNIEKKIVSELEYETIRKHNNI